MSNTLSNSTPGRQQPCQVSNARYLVSFTNEHGASNTSKYESKGASQSEVSVEEPLRASGSQQKKRRRVTRVVRVSCTHCRQAKQACDNFRPCSRCIRLCLQSTCVDAPSSRTRRCFNENNDITNRSKSAAHLGGDLYPYFDRDCCRSDCQDIATTEQTFSGPVEESSCASSFLWFSRELQRDRLISQEEASEDCFSQNSAVHEDAAKLFIPVDCLTKGRPLIPANSKYHYIPSQTTCGEVSETKAREQWRPALSSKLCYQAMGESFVSFTNNENPSGSRNDFGENLENFSDTVYSLSLRDALMFAAGKIWDLMASWDQELQWKSPSRKDQELIDIAKSEILFYFVARSFDKYVQFFSAKMEEPPYCKLFGLNAAIQSLESASEEFAQKMFSLLPPKSPVLSDDQQNLFLESIPIAAMKMSVSLDDSWHKILYVNGECCDLFGTSRGRLIELLSDPSSLHIIFVDNGWIVEPLKTLYSLRHGILKRKSNFKLRSLRNEILDCLISSSFGTDSNWLPQYVIFYIQNIQIVDGAKGFSDCVVEEKPQRFQVYSTTTPRDNTSSAKSLPCWNSIHSDSSSFSYRSHRETSPAVYSQSSAEQVLYPHV